jgi:hypothetical protein
MDRSTALRRVRTCLRLAASSNPHEAAAALRQAQALMAQFGIGHAEAMNVDEAEAPTRARGAEVPGSILLLATICANGFGARLVHVQMDGRTVIRFYGIDGIAQIASYAFTILRRQLDTDRFKHVARVRKTNVRKVRGENFANAWVFAIKQLFPKADVSESHRALLDETIRLRYPTITTFGDKGDEPDEKKAAAKKLPVKKVGTRLTESDWLAGYRKGLDARLHTGIQGSGTAESANDQLALEFHA